jgi:hypothetical protein
MEEKALVGEKGNPGFVTSSPFVLINGLIFLIIHLGGQIGYKNPFQNSTTNVITA